LDEKRPFDCAQPLVPQFSRQIREIAEQVNALPVNLPRSSLALIAVLGQRFDKWR
jgi:hypothetical protein